MTQWCDCRYFFNYFFLLKKYHLHYIETMETTRDDNISSDVSDIDIIGGALNESIDDYLASIGVQPVWENIEPLAKGVEGNTSSPPPNDRMQRVFWCFTWNNYPENFLEILERRFSEICKRYTFQQEVGANGTPHIQGAIGLKKKMRWTEFNLPREIHWEKMNTRGEGAFNYCKKKDTRFGDKYWEVGAPSLMGPECNYVPPKRELKLISKLRPWQDTVEKMCMEEPDDRTINWIYDPLGNIGKTAFTKYMLATHNTLANTGGAVKDVACMIALAVENGFEINEISTFIFNYARSTSHVNYVAIEGIKDGLISSNKYESATLMFNSPHIWIFSNEMPNLDALTHDRWKIWQVVNDELREFPVNDGSMLKTFIERPISNSSGFEPFEELDI